MKVGDRSLKEMFLALRASVSSKNKGGGGGGPAIPLDPPLVPIKFTSYVTSFAVSRVYH